MKQDLREALKMTNLISLVQDEKKGYIPLEKELTKYLHNILWTLRGRHGVTHVKLLVHSFYLDTGIGGSPKEEVMFNTLIETVQVVVTGPTGAIILMQEVFREVTQVGDYLNSTSTCKTMLKGGVIHGTRAFTLLIDKIVRSRVDYFKNLEVKIVTDI